MTRSKSNNLNFTKASAKLLEGLPTLAPRGKPRKLRFQMTQAEFDKEHERLTLKRQSINALSEELSRQWNDLIRDTDVVEDFNG